MRYVKKFESALIRCESFLLVTLLTIMVVMAFSQVIMRQFFGTGILWGDTFLRHLVLWVGFLGAALATAEGKQFAWDMGVTMLKPRPKAAANMLAHLATIIICIFLIRAAWLFCADEKAAGSVLFSMGDIAVPTWAFILILPGGFGLVAIHTLIKGIYAAGEFKNPGSVPEKKEAPPA